MDFPRGDEMVGVSPFFTFFDVSSRLDFLGLPPLEELRLSVDADAVCAVLEDEPRDSDLREEDPERSLSRDALLLAVAPRPALDPRLPLRVGRPPPPPRGGGGMFSARRGAGDARPRVRPLARGWRVQCS